MIAEESALCIGGGLLLTRVDRSDREVDLLALFSDCLLVIAESRDILSQGVGGATYACARMLDCHRCSSCDLSLLKFLGEESHGRLKMLTVTLAGWTAWMGVALTVLVRLGPFLFLSAFAAASLALRFSFRIWTERNKTSTRKGIGIYQS